MIQRKRHSLILIAAMMTTGLIVILAAVSSVIGSVSAETETLRVDQQAFGSADLQWGIEGILTDPLTSTLSSEPAVLTDLGEIDVAFWLEISDTTVPTNVHGYVDLSKTLVFTAEHEVEVTLMTPPMLEPVGPRVDGSLNNGNLTLISERFVYVNDIGKTLGRQFRLIGTVSDGIATGEYRETVWGYGSKPLTIVGEFELLMVEAPEESLTAVSGLGIAADANTISSALVAALVLLGLVTVVVRRRKQSF